MNLQKIQKKKGISPIIATLLLILIAIAAGVIVYAYVVGFIGSQSPSAPQVGTDQLTITAVTNTSDTSLTVYVQNVGQTKLNVSSIFVYFVNGTLSQEATIGSGYSISAGSTSPVISTITQLSSGTYYVKATTSTGSTAVSSNFKE